MKNVKVFMYDTDLELGDIREETLEYLQNETINAIKSAMDCFRKSTGLTLSEYWFWKKYTKLYHTKDIDVIIEIATEWWETLKIFKDEESAEKSLKLEFS